MSITTEIVSLRRNQSSSVETLIAKIEWLKAAEEEAHISSREFGVREAADIVLLNVAAHAAEALIEPPLTIRPAASLDSRRKLRHTDPGRCINVGCTITSSKPPCYSYFLIDFCILYARSECET
jgi:hypothetical protein